MKTIKLIVFLSLFLVSHSTFAQMSPKLQTFFDYMNEVNTEIELIKNKKEGERTAEENKDLVVLEMYKKQLEDSIRLYIQKEEARRKINAALKNIPNENEKQMIQASTSELYAREISPDEYQRRIEEILFKRSEIFINIQRYNSEIANYDSQIANYDSEMTNIKERLSSKVYEITNLKVNIKNMQKDPNNPYAFSNAVNTIYQKEKGKPLPNSIKQKIQQTYDVEANIYADKASKKENLESKKENLESEKEKAKKEYDKLQKAYDLMCKECPQCCKQE